MAKDDALTKLTEEMARLQKLGEELAAARKAKEERFRNSLGTRLKTPPSGPNPDAKESDG